MTGPPPGIWFFLNGAIALFLLLLVTFLMAPDPSVNALRGLIIAGLVIVGIKLVLRRRGVEWPRR
jgi:hypothetical protein